MPTIRNWGAADFLSCHSQCHWWDQHVETGQPLEGKYTFPLPNAFTSKNTAPTVPMTKVLVN